VDSAAARVAAVVAERVVTCAGGGVAAGDDVAHADAAPGQARQVTAVVEGQVVGVRDVVDRTGELLVLRISQGAIFLLACFLSFFSRTEG
jgi:hypothetical protein